MIIITICGWMKKSHWCVTMHVCALPTCKTLVCCFVLIRLMAQLSHIQRPIFSGSMPMHCMSSNGSLSSPHELASLHGLRNHKHLQYASQKGFLSSFLLLIVAPSALPFFQECRFMPIICMFKNNVCKKIIYSFISFMPIYQLVTPSHHSTMVNKFNMYKNDFPAHYLSNKINSHSRINITAHIFLY